MLAGKSVGLFYLQQFCFIVTLYFKPPTNEIKNGPRTASYGSIDDKRSTRCSGGGTRTRDLRIMSPTSYQLLYPTIERQIYKLYYIIIRFTFQFVFLFFSHYSIVFFLNPAKYPIFRMGTYLRTF